MTCARRALALIDDSALDAPELRCRAILVIGECLTWNPVGDFASARALLSEAGWLAVEHGWPHLAARAAITYQWLVQPGVVDPTAAELVRGGARHGRRGRLAASAGRDRCAVLEVRTAIAPIMNVASPQSRPRPPTSKRCDPLGRMLVADNRWWLHFADADADDRTLAHDYALPPTRSEGSGCPRVRRGARLVPATRGPRRLRRPRRGVRCSSRLAPAWDWDTPRSP